MKPAAANSASRTPTKPRAALKAVGDSSPLQQRKAGAAAENCDPNVAAKRTTPVKLFRARAAASPKKDLEQVLAHAGEEDHAVASSAVTEEVGDANVAGVSSASAAGGEVLETPGKAGVLVAAKCGASPRTCVEQGSAHSAGGRKHICKSARCAANDPDYAIPAPTPPRKFLLSKRHILQQQLEESLKRYKKCSSDGRGGVGQNVDAVESVVGMHGEEEGEEKEEALTTGGDLRQGGIHPAQELGDAEINFLPEEVVEEGADAVINEQAAASVDAQDPVSIVESSALERQEECVPDECMQAAESVETQCIQSADTIASAQILDASVAQSEEEVETVFHHACTPPDEAVLTGCIEATNVREEDLEGISSPADGDIAATEPVATIDVLKEPEPAFSELTEVGEELHMEAAGSDCQPAVLPGVGAAGPAEATQLVDGLPRRQDADEAVNKTEPSDELLSRSASNCSTHPESEASEDEDWVFLDPLTAPLDIGETLVTDVSGRPSLVGNYLTARAWGKRKSNAPCPTTGREVVTLQTDVSSCRKSFSEWKLDCAMMEALAGKDPHGEGRVRTLVEAFEKVISLTECTRVLPKHAYRKFSICPRRKQVAASGPQPDSEPPQPEEGGVEWVKVDVITVCDQEDEVDGIGTRDSVASLTSSCNSDESEECAKDLENRRIPALDELEALHKDFAGVDLWKHFIFALPPAADVGEECQLRSEERGQCVAQSEVFQIEEVLNQAHADAEAPQHYDAAAANTNDARGLSEAEEYGNGKEASSIDYEAYHFEVAENTDEAEGPADDSQHDRAHVEQCEDCRNRAQHSHLHASETWVDEIESHVEVPDYGTHCTGEVEGPSGNIQQDQAHDAECGNSGNRIQLEEHEHCWNEMGSDERGTIADGLAEADIDGRDSSSDNVIGHACHTGRGPPPRRVIPTTEPQPFKLHTEVSQLCNSMLPVASGSNSVRSTDVRIICRGLKNCAGKGSCA